MRHLPISLYLVLAGLPVAAAGDARQPVPAAPAGAAATVSRGQAVPDGLPGQDDDGLHAATRYRTGQTDYAREQADYAVRRQQYERDRAAVLAGNAERDARYRQELRAWQAKSRPSGGSADDGRAAGVPLAMAGGGGAGGIVGARVVCSRPVVTGSLIRSRPVCRSVAEVREARRATEYELDLLRNAALRGGGQTRPWP